MFNEKQIKNAMPEETFNLFVYGFSDLEHIGRWTLVGGTALSIRYHHRLSEDLDFFIGKATLEEEKGRIRSMIVTLRSKGFSCVQTVNDDDQIDYQINGVKVTFHASGLKNLKESCNFFGNIEIAGVNTIIAMKMDAIIEYRTKTRDLYDIYTIFNHNNISLFEMLDLYNSHTNENYSDALILKRLTSKALDNDDEGLDDMNATGLSNFTTLREWVKASIKKEADEDTGHIITLDIHNDKIQEYKDRCFGLERLSLVQKYAVLGKDDMVTKCLELSAFELSYKNLSGKNLLDYYVEDPDMYQKILEYSKEIPPDIMAKDPKYMTDSQKKLLAFLKLENRIIHDANKNCSKERLVKNAEKFDLELEQYREKVESKRILLKSI